MRKPTMQRDDYIQTLFFFFRVPIGCSGQAANKAERITARRQLSGKGIKSTKETTERVYSQYFFFLEPLERVWCYDWALVFCIQISNICPEGNTTWRNINACLKCNFDKVWFNLPQWKSIQEYHGHILYTILIASGSKSRPGCLTEQSRAINTPVVTSWLQ